MMRIFLMTSSLVFYVCIMILNIIIIGDGLHKWSGIGYSFVSVFLSGVLLFVMPSMGLCVSLFCAIYAPAHPLYIYILAYIPLMLIILDLVYAVPLPQVLHFENFNLMAFLNRNSERQIPPVSTFCQTVEMQEKPVMKKKVTKVKAKKKTMKKTKKTKKAKKV
jgi:hypothetical protein